MNRVRFDLDRHGQTARIVLAAPKANILDHAMMGELLQALNGTVWDNVNAVVLTGEGAHFSFGASVQEHLPDQIGPTLALLRELLHTLARVPAVTIAAVRGQCLGGGFELALACDLIIADDTAQFALPEIKLGVFPPAGTALLPLRIGSGRAAELVLTGASWNASQAAAAGLVQQVFAGADFDHEFEKWLKTAFFERSTIALRYATQAVRQPLLRVLEDELPALEDLYKNELMSTPDSLEGILAFLEKRRPKWGQVPVHS